jgi:hypothetical protein
MQQQMLNEMGRAVADARVSTGSNGAGTFGTPYGFAAEIAGKLKAAPPLPAFAGPFARKGFNNVSTWSSGHTSMNAVAQFGMRCSVIAKPFLDGMEQDMVSGSAIFSAINDESGEKGLRTVADIPILNYLFELAAVEAGRARVVETDFPETISDLIGYADGTIALTPQELVDKWAYLGTKMPDDNSHTGIGTSLIPYVPYGGVQHRNIYGQRVRPGQCLFLTARNVNLSGDSQMLNPNGVAVAGRSSLTGPVLQLAGFSSAETTFCPNDSSVTSVGQYTNAIHNRPTQATDLDFIQREKRLASEYKPLEFDEFTGNFYHSDPMREGQQDALESVPDLVYDAYTFGVSFMVGHARTGTSLSLSPGQMKLALRSRAVLSKVPTIGIMAGVN